MEEKRLRLVVAMMGKRDELRTVSRGCLPEKGVAQPARGFLNSHATVLLKVAWTKRVGHERPIELVRQFPGAFRMIS
jgi:hypothetical protein